MARTVFITGVVRSPVLETPNESQARFRESLFWSTDLDETQPQGRSANLSTYVVVPAVLRVSIHL